MLTIHGCDSKNFIRDQLHETKGKKPLSYIKDEPLSCVTVLRNYLCGVLSLISVNNSPKPLTNDAEF